MKENQVDVITREVIRGGLEFIAEEMGIILRNAAYSTNIKERMDHSCSLFDYKGRMLAQAEHIPVHLGAMPLTVKSVIETFEGEINLRLYQDLGQFEINTLGDLFKQPPF